MAKATQAEKKEWEEFFPEIEYAVISGALDSKLDELAKLVKDRKVEARRSTPPQIHRTDLVSKMIGTNARNNYDGNEFYHLGKWYDGIRLLGKVVTINNRVRPNYMAGLKVRVIKVNQKTAKVEYVTFPKNDRGGSLANAERFNLPYSLMEMEWK